MRLEDRRTGRDHFTPASTPCCYLAAIGNHDGGRTPRRRDCSHVARHPSAGVGEVVPGDTSRRRDRPRRRARRAGGAARPERRRQDDDAADAARHHHPRPGVGRAARSPAPAGAQQGDGARRVRGGISPAAVAHEGARGARAVRRPLRPDDDRDARIAEGLDAVRHRPPRRREGRRAVVRTAHAGRHREVGAAPARRCWCSTSRPRRSIPMSRCACRTGLRAISEDAGHRAARHEPRHGRGRAHVRPRGVRREGSRRRRRARSRRSPPSTATSHSRRCSSISPPSTRAQRRSTQ